MSGASSSSLSCSRDCTSRAAFPQRVAREIEAAETEFNYQMELVFDTENNRRKWVDSKEHAKAWPLASGMAEQFAWRGYDVVGSDRNPG